jgi:5-methylcytosine-specific restriction endonuclease McrA
MYECEICGDVLDTETGRKIHKSRLHEESKLVEFTCPECGEDFEDYNSRRSSKNEENNFCSRECKYSFDKTGEKVDCSWCGSKVYKSKSHLDKMGNYTIDNHFCNKDCEKEWKQSNWTGEDHPSWEGGHEFHRGESWHTQRRKALKRDGYACTICCMTRDEHQEFYDQDLEVHHKIPERTFDNPNNAHFQLNLLTVCCGCHGKVERISQNYQENKLVI